MWSSIFSDCREYERKMKGSRSHRLLGHWWWLMSDVSNTGVSQNPLSGSRTVTAKDDRVLSLLHRSFHSVRHPLQRRQTRSDCDDVSAYVLIILIALVYTHTSQLIWDTSWFNMVVTRKTPVPMPPASRTPSTLSTPKVGKGKSSHSSPLSQDDGGSPVKMNSPNVKYVGPQFSDDAMFIVCHHFLNLWNHVSSISFFIRIHHPRGSHRRKNRKINLERR